MTDVFISYSRKDAQFVHWLHDTLKQQGRDVWVDFEDIPRGADWLNVIYDAIESADTFVLVVSPDSLISEVVNQEIKHAIELNKRIIPLIRRDVNPRELVVEWFEQPWEDDARDNWQAIRHINWLFFRDGDDIRSEMAELLNIIDVDLAYVQTHTRILVRAKDWESRGRDPSFLLSGTEMYDATTWLAASENKKPAPTDLHREYINASKQRQTGTRRRIFVSVVISIVMTGLLIASVIFSIQAGNAADKEAEANATANVALTRNAMAGATLAAESTTSKNNENRANQQGTVIANALDSSQNTESLFLADLSNRRREQGAIHDAILLAQQSLANGIVHGENQTALVNALSSPVQERFFLDHPAPVNGAVWGDNRRDVLSWAGNAVYVWTLNQPGTPVVLPHDVEVQFAMWDADERMVLTVTNETVRVWDLDDIDVPLTFRHATLVNDAQWNPNGRFILTTTSSADMFIWDIENPETPTVLSHGDMVRGATWREDGQQILSWSYDATVRLWDFNGGDTSQAVRLFFHDAPVNGAAFTQDAQGILSWSYDGDMRLWDVNNSDAPLLQFLHDETRATRILSAVFTRDEQRILTLTEDGVVRIWKINSDTPASVLENSRQAAVVAVSWNNDETAVLIQYDDDVARVWFPAEGGVLDLEHNGRVGGGVWSVEDSSLLTWSDDDTVRIWDVRGGAPPVLLGHDENVRGALWNEEDDRVLSWSDDGSVRIWDLDEARASLTMPNMASVIDAAWSPDSNQLTTFTQSSVVNVWHTNSGNQALALDHNPNSVSNGLWNPNGRFLLTWADESGLCEGCSNSVYVWDVDTASTAAVFDHTNAVEFASWDSSGEHFLIVSGSFVNLWALDNLSGDAIMLLHDSPVDDARFSPDGQRLATIAGGIVRVWDLSNGIDAIPQTPLQFTRNTFLNRVAWSADNTRLMAWGDTSDSMQQGVATASNEQPVVVVWEVNAPDMQPEALPHDNAVVAAVFSPTDSTRILVWTTSNVARVWTLNEPGNPSSITLRHNNAIRGAAWDADGSHVLTYSEGSTARVWDVAETGSPPIILRHNSSVIGARWDSGGSRILSWSADGTTRIWNIAGVTSPEALGTPLRLISPAPVLLAVWNPDETRVFTWAVDGTARIWDTDLEDLLAIAQDASEVRDLSANEDRQRFFLPTFEPTEAEVTATMPVTPLPTLTPTPSPVPAFAGSINFGETVRRDIAQPGDRNEWRFEGQANQIVSISLNDDNSGLDPFLTLLAPDGSELISNDDSNNTLNALIDNFTLPATGEYTIIAAAFGNSTGMYTLSLVDLNMMTATPSPTPVPPQMVSEGNNRGAFTAFNEVHTWTFEGRAGQTIILEVLADTPLDFNAPVSESGQPVGLNLAVDIFAPSGNFLTSSDDFEDDGRLLSDVRIEGLMLPEDGTYTINVFNRSQDPTGEYTLRIKDVERPTVTPTTTMTPSPPPMP